MRGVIRPEVSKNCLRFYNYSIVDENMLLMCTFSPSIRSFIRSIYPIKYAKMKCHQIILGNECKPSLLVDHRIKYIHLTSIKINDVEILR